MATRIRITAGSVRLEAELNDSPTALAIAAVLPIQAAAQTWGDEIYFPVPVKQGLDATAAEVVDVGAMAYWPTGKALCIFFGPTPMSRGAEIRPASAVNLIGKVLGDARQLTSIRDGEPVRLDRIGME
jgi:uncharacterized protein